MSQPWIPKIPGWSTPRGQRDDVLCISNLSSLKSAEPWGISQQTHLFKIANRWPRAMGSVEKGIKRPKCVAQKPLKKVNRTQGVKRSQPICDLVYGASSYPFPLVLLYFRRWFTIGATVHLCFPLIFFSFTFLLDNAPRPTSDAAMRRGTSSATLRNFRNWRSFSCHSKGSIFLLDVKQ